MMDVVTSVDNKSTQRINYTRHKAFDYVSIVSHNDIYDFQIEPEYKEVFVV
jgi:hypothetical protein